jgi:threonine dehydrogenase-like Zn-dependent dehydrogenase
MKALKFSEKLELVENYPRPVPAENEALIRVLLAGICNTDLEIIKGYMGFKGILGHEFVGIVEKIHADNQTLLHKRVVGEINCGCKNLDCSFCNQGLQRHCPDRKVLGIYGKDGCMAEYITLPLENLLAVPDSVKDEEACFCEPLAAGFEILEQVDIRTSDDVLILGDGKLGILIDFALQNTMANITHAGKHKHKLAIVAEKGVRTVMPEELDNRQYDFVVEATGTSGGLKTALQHVKPRGAIVLKSTTAAGKEIDLTPLVINEITLVGSRCGRFGPALKALEKGVNIRPLISAVVPFEKALDAFAKAGAKGTLKVLLDLR